MKGKKMTYLLIVGAVAVWGIIFYRVYAAVTEEVTVPMEPPVKKVAYFKEVDHQKDSITLNLNYRDPFSTASYVPETKEARPVPAAGRSVITQPQMQQQPINWSMISYKGYVGNPTTKQRLAILHINGVEALLAEGQSSNGLKLLKNFGDSIKISYKSFTKNIRIN